MKKKQHFEFCQTQILDFQGEFLLPGGGERQDTHVGTGEQLLHDVGVVDLPAPRQPLLLRVQLLVLLDLQHKHTPHTSLSFLTLWVKTGLWVKFYFIVFFIDEKSPVTAQLRLGFPFDIGIFQLWSPFPLVESPSIGGVPLHWWSPHSFRDLRGCGTWGHAQWWPWQC